MKSTNDAADSFFYYLLKDHLPAGAMEAALRGAERASLEELECENKHIAAYAHEVRRRLEAVAQKQRTLLPHIDFLRKNHTKIHFFGLGFIQVKMSHGFRYHFYHPTLPPFVENPHDHRYHFTSTVLRGALEHDVWKILPKPQPTATLAIKRFESCSPDVSPPTLALRSMLTW